jgi:PTH1 family peptidyl-tRNA hydrolase
MFLIVGLGNPGEKYSETRHNVGFQVVERLAGQADLRFGESKWKAQVCKGALAGQAVVLAKPQTFMNLSGEAVAPLAAYYKVEPENIIVIHDDLDLDCGRIKLAAQGGAGGHNGIKSLIQHLGTRSFSRVRIGIGRPPQFMPVERFVLARFDGHEAPVMAEAVDRAVEAVDLIVAKGLAAAMQVIHGS